MTSSPDPARPTPERPRRVLVVLVDRANYGRLKPVMHAIQAHPALTLQVVVAGTMVLERFHRPMDLVAADGFPIDAACYIELEGSVPATMARSLGFGVVEFSGTFQRLVPDVVLLIGDRYEALAAALAAAYMNCTLVHIQGGEVSGSIDESARHAITKFAHFHVPATQRAAEYLVRLGERPETILAVGCPSSDLALGLQRQLSDELLNARGNGAELDAQAPFLLAVYHPTTTAFGGEYDQMMVFLEALEAVRMPTLLLWPNIDAGSDQLSKAIRVFRDRHGAQGWLRTRTNLTPEAYLQVLAAAACAVGNSSSFVRDAGFLGTPVVLVGDRQQGREADEHVQRLGLDREALSEAIQAQVAHGRYAPSRLYGDGQVSERVAEAVARLVPYTQKRLAYVDEPLARPVIDA